jgi:hypothetical protein
MRCKRWGKCLECERTVSERQDSGSHDELPTSPGGSVLEFEPEASFFSVDQVNFCAIQFGRNLGLKPAAVFDEAGKRQGS